MIDCRDIENNHFSGWIPNKLKDIESLKWVGAKNSLIHFNLILNPSSEYVSYNKN